MRSVLICRTASRQTGFRCGNYSRSLLWDVCHGKICIKYSLEPNELRKLAETNGT